jgi:hypothetical protein
MKTKRSITIRNKFLKSKGYSKTPRGKEVAHKKALALGGKDDPRNMTLKKKSTHRKETKRLLRKLAKKHK